MSTPYTLPDIAGMIDHSLLKPATTVEELEAGCHLALDLGVASVCLLPYYQKRCADILRGSSVRSSTTIGFPHGANTTAVKVAEAAQAVEDGCQELDVVVNISQVLSGEWAFVEADLKAMIDIAEQAGQATKVIFENCYLNSDQKIQLCRICTDLGADWVKTSTGYGSHGAQAEDLTLMVQNTPESVQVKAAGGIRTLDTLLSFRDISPRVTRCGASATQAILDECRQRLETQDQATGD